ncbi:hypothetical protein AVEN_63408-1 [Araneus ventricosus]|uniref:Uncharacterized protein n=1 Tax=Araneus ventricosus TaxID=182803 RepID=A0A4Y2K639_ARAVE|nr:hypothetical protein AVEN_63408-1 [Araneus ventricosus]
MEFLTFWKIPGRARISQTATEMRAMTSSTEQMGSCTSMSSFDPSKRNPEMTGVGGHHWCNVGEPHHVGTTLSGATTEEYVLSGKRSSNKRRAVLLYSP